MAILAALFAFGSRFVGKVLTTTLGWATTLLFGRVPASRQYLLLGITFGSVIWMVLLVGVLVPDVGAFLLVLVPPQDLVPQWVIRVAMLIGAIVVPGVVGGLTFVLARPAGRSTISAWVTSVLRGYPLTALLALLLVFLAGLAVFRKVWSLAHRWSDTHVPIVVKPGAYDTVARDLDAAISAAGLEVAPRAAPSAMSTPARWLARVAGTGAASLVPDRMVQLHGPDLDILIYPMDLLISGSASNVTRARAAMASRLTTSAAHLTISAEAQAIEDRLTRLATRPGAAADRPSPFDDVAQGEFAAIDDALARIEIPYDEWEVLYRQRLQVERDLRAGAMTGEAILGAPQPDADANRLAGTLARVGRLVRTGATAVVEAAGDPETVETLDKIGGTEWRLAVRAASVGAAAVRAVLNDPARDGDPAEDPAADTGEPLSQPRSSEPTEEPVRA